MPIKLKLLLTFDYDSNFESFRFNQNNDNCNELENRDQDFQGAEIEVCINVEHFEIAEIHKARIKSDGEFYLMHEGDNPAHKEKFIINELSAGVYRLSEEDNIIYIVDVEEYFVPTKRWMGMYDYPRGDYEEEKVFDLITKSAKGRFAYNDFSKQFEFHYTQRFLFLCIVAIASGESLEIAAYKLNSEIMRIDFRIRIKELISFLKEREKDFAMEILAYKMAIRSFNRGTDPNTVFLQTEKLLRCIETNFN